MTDVKRTVKIEKDDRPQDKRHLALCTFGGKGTSQGAPELDPFLLR